MWEGDGEQKTVVPANLSVEAGYHAGWQSLDAANKSGDSASGGRFRRSLHLAKLFISATSRTPSPPGPRISVVPAWLSRSAALRRKHALRGGIDVAKPPSRPIATTAGPAESINALNGSALGTGAWLGIVPWRIGRRKARSTTAATEIKTSGISGPSNRAPTTTRKTTAMASRDNTSTARTVPSREARLFAGCAVRFAAR